MYMKDLIREILNVGILLILIIIGVIFVTAINDAKPAKALRFEAINKPNGISTLTKEERDEYMEYLRVLNGSIYEWELP